MPNRGRSRRHYRVSASATVVGVAVLGLCVVWAVVACGDNWLGRALRDPLSLKAGGAALLSLVALYLVVGVMWRLGRTRRRPGGQSGTAAIEFVLLFPVALCIVLVMIQSVLVVTGNIVVHYAAYAAARAAVVWVPEKVSYEEPRNVVGNPAYSAKMLHIRGAAVEVLKAVSASASGAGGAGEAPGSVVLKEGYDRFFSLHNRPTPRWVQTMLPGKYDYAWEYTEVTLAPPADGEKYGDHEDLTVSVRHWLYLSVPYAKRFFGDRLPGGRGDYATETTATCTLTNQGVEDEIDVEVFPRYVGRGEG